MPSRRSKRICSCPAETPSGINNGTASCLQDRLDISFVQRDQGKTSLVMAAVGGNANDRAAHKMYLPILPAANKKAQRQDGLRLIKNTRKRLMKSVA